MAKQLYGWMMVATVAIALFEMGLGRRNLAGGCTALGGDCDTGGVCCVTGAVCQDPAVLEFGVDVISTYLEVGEQSSEEGECCLKMGTECTADEQCCLNSKTLAGSLTAISAPRCGAGKKCCAGFGNSCSSTADCCPEDNLICRQTNGRGLKYCGTP